MPIYALNCIFSHLLHVVRLFNLIELCQIIQAQTAKCFHGVTIAAAAVYINKAAGKEDLRMLLFSFQYLNIISSFFSGDNQIQNRGMSDNQTGFGNGITFI